MVVFVYRTGATVLSSSVFPAKQGSVYAPFLSLLMMLSLLLVVVLVVVVFVFSWSWNPSPKPHRFPHHTSS